MAEAATWVQITRGGRPGPWHAENGAYRQAWCGSRLTGFNKRRVDEADVPAGEPRCRDCTRALAEGRARAWRGKR